MSVRPTKSGVTVERRDQVLIGFRSRCFCMAVTFFNSFSSMYGPLLIERLIPPFLSRTEPLISFYHSSQNGALEGRDSSGSPCHDVFGCLLLFAARLEALGQLAAA